MTTYIPKSKKDKKLRNKIELITLSFYTLGLILFGLTKNPICVLITLLSVPFCFWKPINNFLNK